MPGVATEPTKDELPVTGGSNRLKLSNANICFVAQDGTLQYEALLAVLTLKAFCRDSHVNLYACVPRNGPNWTKNPEVRDPQLLRLFDDLGVHVVLFENTDWGSSYPHSNKAYAIGALPRDEPFAFFDSDHIFYGDVASVELDFAQPSLREAGQSWPKKLKRGATAASVWADIYRRAGLDPETGRLADRLATGVSGPRPYYNGGFFYHENAGLFFDRYIGLMRSLAETPPAGLPPRHLYPWLDQVCLAVMIQTFGSSFVGTKKAFPLSGTARHYFAISNLAFDRNGPVLKTAQDIVLSPEFSPVFRNSPQHRAFFFEGGLERIQAEIAAQKGRSQPEIKEILRKKGLWLK